MKNHILHLTSPTDQWCYGSPIGNGAMGAMIFGGVALERIALNEESIWDGGPMDTKSDSYAGKLAHIRRLFLEGKEYEADQWTAENMGDVFHRIKSYEYAGELLIKLHENDLCTDYRRDIDLNDGICTVAYEKDGIHYRRDTFASYPANMICSRLTADGKFNAAISFERENMLSAEYREDSIIAECRTATVDNRFKVFIKIVTDGDVTIKDSSAENATAEKVATENAADENASAENLSAENVAAEDISSEKIFKQENYLNISGAAKIEIHITIQTAFKNPDWTSADSGQPDLNWDMLYAEHVKDHSALMNRSDIRFDSDPSLEELSVQERLDRLKNDPAAQDYGLIDLYWAYGKYLLIGSSRPGTLPANLQGVWAYGLNLPWNSDYHTNINLQMNYWHAEEANLSECTQPLFDYMNSQLLPAGKRVAQENYGTRGMVVHHLSDIYEFAAAADGLWGMWPMGGAWLAYHMWEHYLYTNDKEFLRNTAYTYIRECALFFMDNLHEGSDGYLHSGPSTSPENRYLVDVDGEQKIVYLAMSPTMDVEIIGGLLDFYAESEKILGVDPDTGKLAAQMRAKLVPLRIGKHGQLMEWLHDYDEVEPGHRHISHAFGLYPATQITKNTPELFAAIETTLKRRLSFGGGHTGWSRAWLINLFARLYKGQEAYDNIRSLLTDSTYCNLFDTHPWRHQDSKYPGAQGTEGKTFQIDGNFGGAAGIGEMLLQSHDGTITILPAVPDFLNGEFYGLRARGGITVSAKWHSGKVTWLRLESDRPTSIVLKLPGENERCVEIIDNVEVTIP